MATYLSLLLGAIMTAQVISRLGTYGRKTVKRGLKRAIAGDPIRLPVPVI